MLLWINVVTDGFPAIALGMDRPQKNILHLSPRLFQTEIISKKVWIEMVVFGCLLTVATLGIYQLNLNEHVIEAKGAAFIAIALFELVYLFIIRATYGTKGFSNRFLFIAIFVTILLQIAIVYIPFLANIFDVRHIDLIDWEYIIAASIGLSVLLRVLKRAI